eukprot:2421545-Alexandrium_andersonii.AAC.1
MLAFCKALPDMCRTSVINRGAFRDGGWPPRVQAFLGEFSKQHTDCRVSTLTGSPWGLVQASAFPRIS